MASHKRTLASLKTGPLGISVLVGWARAAAGDAVARESAAVGMSLASATLSIWPSNRTTVPATQTRFPLIQAS